MSPYPAGVPMEPNGLWQMVLVSAVGVLLGTTLGMAVVDSIVQRLRNAKHRAEMEQALADLTPEVDR